jgi:hypothetical protein
MKLTRLNYKVIAVVTEPLYYSFGEMVDTIDLKSVSFLGMLVQFQQRVVLILLHL